MKEAVLYNKWNEPEAISVQLEEIKELLESIQPELSISIDYDDYDDYGCEHYLTIHGECADLMLKKDYGGMYCPGDSLICSVQPHCIRDSSTFLITIFSFKATAPKEVNIGKNYADRITKFFNEHKKYLKGSNVLFTRTENIHFNDPRGDKLFANPRFSMSSKTLTDSEFHTGKDNIFKPDIRNIQFWSANEANILSDHKFNDKEYTNIKRVDEWEALSYLIKEKKMRWVVDALIENSVFFINDDGHLDCSHSDDAPRDLNINKGELKELCHSEIIKYAFNNGFKFKVILDIIDDQSIESEYDEECHWTTYILKDMSQIVIYDNRTDVICTHEPPASNHE